MKQKTKYIVLCVSIVFSIVVIVTGMVYERKRLKALPAKVETEVVVKKKSTKDNSIASLYEDDQSYFLAKGITQEQINASAENLSESQLNDVQERFNIQEAFNRLFMNPVLSGDQFEADGQLVKGSDLQSVKEQVDTLLKTKENDPFYLGISEYLSKQTLPVTQKSDVKSDAERLMASLLVDGQVKSDFTMDEYTQARDAIAALPVGEEKNELLAKLTKVQESLTNMGIEYE